LWPEANFSEWTTNGGSDRNSHCLRERYGRLVGRRTTGCCSTQGLLIFLRYRLKHFAGLRVIDGATVSRIYEFLD
jgi:hypothetical protein